MGVQGKMRKHKSYEADMKFLNLVHEDTKVRGNEIAELLLGGNKESESKSSKRGRKKK
jgi:hypothetical protein